jgi:hypothetical protein
MKFPAAHLSDFADDILVVCSRCSGRAHILRISDAWDRHDGSRLVCPACGLSRDWRLSLSAGGGMPEPGSGPNLIGFDVSLWLQTPCCGETLWTYNLAHIEFLECYVAASLRGRSRDPKWSWANRSLQSRLPRWMLEKHHRDDVLAALSRLRSIAEQS